MSAPDGTGSAELDARIQAYANAIVFHEGVGETRAALIAAVRELVRDAKRWRWWRQSHKEWDDKADVAIAQAEGAGERNNG